MKTAAEQTLSGSGAPLLRVGRTFVGPVFDLMLIGGGLSLLTIGVLTAAGYVGRGSMPTELMLTVVFLCNSTHFAASTVRLYSKPGSFQDLPTMTMLVPLISVAVLTVGLIFADVIGSAIYKLYLTWSPYHYAAQTYGLAAMYAVRSGCKLTASPRSLLWWTCMLPFAYAFLHSNNAGLGWFLSP